MDRSARNIGTTEVRGGLGFDQAGLEAWLAREVEDYAGPIRVEQFRGGQSNPTYKLITPGRSYVLRRKPPGALLPGAHAVDREYRVITALAGQGFPVAKTHGLGDYGKPGNYFARQIARWSRQYREDVEAGRVEAMDRLAEWLPDNVPPDEPLPRVIHGDFRCDNMVFHPERPEVLAVLDWELSTLGHPLADFSYHVMMYRLPEGLAGLDLAALNIPSEADYVAAYCRRTGRDGIPELDFYMAFNLFRLAGIVHGIKGRLVRGTAASAHAAEMVTRLEPLAELGWAQAQRFGAR